MSDKARSSHVPRRWRWAVAVLGVLLAALAGLGWLGGSESGLRVLCALLAQASAGRLQIEAPVGRLLGDWTAQAVRWRDGSQEVEIRQLSVNWSPRELLGRHLAVERIDAASVRMFFVLTPEPIIPPDSLRLPVSARIGHVAIGRVLFGKAEENAVSVAETVDFSIDSDGQQHRLADLRAQVGKLTLAGDAALAGLPPFALKAQASLQGTALGQPFTLTLQGDGPLGQWPVEGNIVSGDEASAKETSAHTSPRRKPGSSSLNYLDSGVRRNDEFAVNQRLAKAAPPSGELQALLTPFAAQALKSVQLQFFNIDPSVFSKNAPGALLDMVANLDNQPAEAGETGETGARGHLSVINRQSGAWDKGRLPLESLQSEVDWQGERLQFDSLLLGLAGGGRLKGQGVYASGQLALDLAASGVDARALDSRLLSTKLAGALRARIGGEEQSLEVDLRDAQLALNAQATLSPEAVDLARLQLAHGEARLAAQGRLELGGERRFSAKGTLQNFDPSRFLPAKDVVRSVINAGFDATGALQPAFALALRFDLRNSRLGAQALSGKGEVDFAAERLRKLVIDLDAAGNRLSAAGAFGKAGDSLRIKLLAPRLEAIGWPGLAGDMQADVVVGGSPAEPVWSGDVQAGRLRFGKLVELKGLALTGQLGSGAQGKAAGVLRCTECASPEAGVPSLALELKLDGTRSQHHLAGALALPEKRALRLTMDGGLLSGRSRQSQASPSFFWRGTLAELSLSSRRAAEATPLLRLTAPASLSLAADALSFGPANFDGLVGRLQVDRLNLAPSLRQSSGRWQSLRPRALSQEFPELLARFEVFANANPQPLVLGSTWDVSFAARAPGRSAANVEVWRESGDLVLGKLALGLSDGRVKATLTQGRVAVNGVLRGSRLGEISAELNAVADSGRQGERLIDPQAPWQGRVQARVPDLAWLSPLLGEGWQLAGQLDGQMQLAGSAARPQFSGQWRGENLALRALDYGMRLEQGQALIELTPERLFLRKLRFASLFSPMPKALKFDENVDAQALTATPGRFEASGELPLGGANGGEARVKLLLDRVGVMQQPDRWVVISGDSEARISERLLDVVGKLRADAGFWALGDSGRARLSDDVVVRRPSAAGEAGQAARTAARAMRFDLDAAFGKSFYFRGVGVESRLAGQLRVRSDDAGLPRATGSIRTVDGKFDAYGQKLDIERGIINFQGTIGNPGLNILAVRRNLPVEAGVEVTGTAQRPAVRLVSTPNVPDTEKLSWLVLGQPPDQRAGGDGGILLAAAQTILGGQDGGALRQLQRGLGIDEIGVSTGRLEGNTSQMSSSVASSSGFSGNQTVSGQILSVGKRISSNAMLSYEQSLDTTESIVKLTVNLNRQFSLVGRAGSESAVDLFWNYSFGK